MESVHDVHAERQSGLGRGLVGAHPAARPAERRDARSRSREIRVNPAPAARGCRRRPSSRPWRRASASTASSSRSSSPRRSTATSSSPASAASGRPGWPASSGSRPSSASSPIASSSSSPSSRTSSARTSTRSRKPTRSGQLIEEFGLTQERDRPPASAAPGSTIANTLRLLELDHGVQAAVADGRLSEGHARALGGPAGRPAGAGSRRRSSTSGLSVRQTEELVRRLREPRAGRAAPSAPHVRSRPRARRGRPAQRRWGPR